MASEAAQQAKNDGSAAWSSGNYAQAAEHFTTAINIGGDKEFLKVLYSNRSAAYLKLSKVTEALRDGNKCVELDSNWAKGYVRKGDALLASKQYTEAYNAYNSAARIAPSDATVKEKCDQAMRAIRNAADATANFARSTGPPGSTGSSSPAPLYVQYAHLAILVLIALYCIPFFSTSYRNISHKLAVGIFAGVAGYNIYLKYGRPQFSTEWVQRIMPDPLFMHLFLSLVLIMHRPYLLSSGTIIMSALSTFSDRLLRYVRENYPQMQAQLQPMIARFAPSLANVDLMRALGPNASREVDKQLMRAAAAMEAYHGLYIIFELVLPSRNLMQIYIWWQYLRMRYMLDQTGNLKVAFQGLDQRAQTLLSMRMCPDAVRKGYAMLQAYLAKQVEMPPAEQQQQSAGGGGLGGMLSKCSIM